jgi:hypothetical protein
MKDSRMPSEQGFVTDLKVIVAYAQANSTPRDFHSSVNVSTRASCSLPMFMNQGYNPFPMNHNP